MATVFLTKEEMQFIISRFDSDLFRPKEARIANIIIDKITSTGEVEVHNNDQIW